jgi:hypothetical protein
MLLHAIHADKVFVGRIIIKSPDTDVLVLCVHYFSKLQHTQELWFQTGTASSTKDRRRYIPVHEICSTLSPVFTISYQLLMLLRVVIPLLCCLV